MSNLRGSPDTEAAVLEQKTKAILEEYFGLKDTAEAYLVSALQLSPSRNFCTFLIYGNPALLTFLSAVPD